jgi:nucleotide-binding universal stress UspA family protein
MYKRILVPLDGSEIAEKVFPIATAEAQTHGALVVLLRVIAPLRQSLMSSPSLINSIYEQVGQIAADYPEELAEEMRNEGIEVETIVVQGPPAQRIHETAQSNPIDLIVIGTHGETGNPQWRSGGVAMKIIRSNHPFPSWLSQHNLQNKISRRL